MLRTLLSLSLIIILNIAAFSQEELSLPDAVRIGLKNNYQIRISELDKEIAANNNRWGTVGRFPSIDLSVSQLNRYDNDLDNNSSSGAQGGDFSTTNVAPAITMNWIIFNGFAANINKKNLEALQYFSEGNAAVIVENTIQAILLAYYKALLENEKLDVLQKVMKLSRDRYEYVQLKKDLGSAVTFDLLQSKNNYLSDSSNYILQKLNHENALRNLNLLMAVDASQKYNLTDVFEFEILEYDLADLLGKILNDNKTLKNQYINQEILKNNIRLEKSAYYPTLSLAAGSDYASTRIKYDGTSPVNSSSLDYYANFVLSYNIFNGRNTRTAVKNSILENSVGLLQIEELKHSLTNQLTNTYEMYNARKQLFNVSEASVESASLNLQIADQKFKSGAINSFNYRDIQLIFLNASFQKLQSVYNLIDTHSELMRLTGSIIAEY
jgi:outer membrane protein